MNFGGHWNYTSESWPTAIFGVISISLEFISLLALVGRYLLGETGGTRAVSLVVPKPDCHVTKKLLLVKCGGLLVKGTLSPKVYGVLAIVSSILDTNSLEPASCVSFGHPGQTAIHATALLACW
jgi:hypothetical protein